MIFRAPAGHWLLSKQELQKIIDEIEAGNTQRAKEYLEFCLEEITFYDEIRQQVEMKKMLKEDGEEFKALSLENKIREKVRQHHEKSQLRKNQFLL